MGFFLPDSSKIVNLTSTSSTSTGADRKKHLPEKLNSEFRRCGYEWLQGTISSVLLRTNIFLEKEKAINQFVAKILFTERKVGSDAVVNFSDG